MRLDKYITLGLNVTRSEAKKIIKNKKIVINNKTITDSSYNVLETDDVLYENSKIEYKEKIYIMMNKKSGYVCANCDNLYPTVFELLDNKIYNPNKLFTIGRLDVDTTGLLIITNDGDLAHKITSPKSNIKKVYYVEVDGSFLAGCSNILQEGITLKDEDGNEYKTRPVNIDFLNEEKNKAYITVTEGKFHEVKKICKYFGLNVLKLHRVQIGELMLDKNLKTGIYRELTKEELDRLNKGIIL